MNTIKVYIILEWKYVYETRHCVPEYITKKSRMEFEFLFHERRRKFLVKKLLFLLPPKVPINQINEWKKTKYNKSEMK